MCVALLAIALLLGPCLSIDGLTGSGAAHAHMHSNGTANHAVDIHAGHHILSADQSDMHLGKTDDNQKVVGCEEQCESSAIQKSSQYVANAWAKNTSRPHGSDGNPTAILVLNKNTTGPPDARRSHSRLAFQNGWLATLPAYAVTNRYRL